MTKYWAPRTDIASVGQPYGHVVPGPPGAPPVARFPVVDLTYTDGTTERVPAKTWAASQAGHREREPGRLPYVVALIIGPPNLALMLYLVSDLFFWPVTLGLAVMSALGCLLAVKGMRSEPRRYRTAVIWLTLIPALAVVAAICVFVLFLILFITTSGNPNS